MPRIPPHGRGPRRLPAPCPVAIGLPITMSSRHHRPGPSHGPFRGTRSCTISVRGRRPASKVQRPRHATDERPGAGGHPASREPGWTERARAPAAPSGTADPARRAARRTARSAPDSPQPSTAQRPRITAAVCAPLQTRTDYATRSGSSHASEPIAEYFARDLCRDPSARGHRMPDTVTNSLSTDELNRITTQAARRSFSPALLSVDTYP